MKRLFIFFSLIVMVAANTSLISDPAFAYDQGFYSSNDILYYNPDDTGACLSADPAATTLNGNTNLEKIYNYMLGKGLTDFQAAGVVGNISRESGGYPDRVQGKSPEQGVKDPSGISVGWGLIQWTPGSKVIGIAKQAGITGPIYSLATQLDIIWWHMNNTTPTGVRNFINEYKTTSSVEQATTLYEEKMEAAGVPALPDRIAAAKLAMAYPKMGAAGGGTVNPCDDGSTSGAAAGNAVQTAINYAWPQYHAPPYTTLKPSYAKAVKAAQDAGKYVGGGIHPGVDCGGFVTRVMQDSGVDPEYNKAKGGTDTQLAYAISSGKYTELHPKSTADMKPGDIAINGEHTYMYVGKNPGFETDIASASYSTTGASWRAPMAGHEKPADPNYRWFRIK